MRSSHYLTRFLPLLILTSLLIIIALRASSDLSHLRPLLAALTERAEALHTALISPLAVPPPPAPVPPTPPSSAQPEPQLPREERRPRLPEGLAHAITSLEHYPLLARSVIARKESRYLRQSPAKLSLARQLGYDEHFDRARRGVEVNALFAQRVAELGRERYALGAQPLGTEEEAEFGIVDLAMGHLSRDWSAQGEKEREAVFPPVLSALQAFFGPQAGAEEGGRRVLVPGSGMGRLASDVADLGFQVTANELDYGSILTYHFLSNTSHTPALHTHTLHPFATKWTHQLFPNSRYTAITFPDHPPNPRVSLIEGDFLKVFPEGGTYDAVVTLFFIDMSESVVDFLENIHRLLKPGGLWVNLGPLKWGTHSDMQLSAHEVLHLASLLGFDVDHQGRRSIDSVYAAQPDTLLRFTYGASPFVVLGGLGGESVRRC
ncbi:N2227-domain-containing protein [Calocera viscosa TUFC12733]|uniref:N2227-domain-containing protein n=1 Tax=Calocera viscosa (strain TUFC12733) TaxID=1330018 RepID=A0A167J7T1_CALVF|nr:N2227-domain-containing protein [Calocera viscosa TUFC12733]